MIGHRNFKSGIKSHQPFYFKMICNKDFVFFFTNIKAMIIKYWIFFSKLFVFSRFKHLFFKYIGLYNNYYSSISFIYLSIKKSILFLNKHPHKDNLFYSISSKLSLVRQNTAYKGTDLMLFLKPKFLVETRIA